MFYCYILHSKNLNHFYTGVSYDDGEERILKHQNEFYGTHRFTASADDWELFLAIECELTAMTRRLELHIKK